MCLSVAFYSRAWIVLYLARESNPPLDNNLKNLRRLALFFPPLPPQQGCSNVRTFPWRVLVGLPTRVRICDDSAYFAREVGSAHRRGHLRPAIIPREAFIIL